MAQELITATPGIDPPTLRLSVIYLPLYRYTVMLQATFSFTTRGPSSAVQMDKTTRILSSL